MKIIGKTNDGYVVEISSAEIANIGGSQYDAEIGYERESNERKGYYNKFRYDSLPINAIINVSKKYCESTKVLNAFDELKTKFKSISTQLNTLVSLMGEKLEIKESVDG